MPAFDSNLLKALQSEWNIETDTLKAMGSKMKRHEFNSGDVVFKDGDRDGRMYAFESGFVEVLVKHPENPNEVVRARKLGPGQTAGFNGLLEGREHQATLRCTSPVICWSLSREDLQHLMDSNQGFLKGVVHILSQKLKALRSDYRGLSLRAGEFGGDDDKFRILCFDAKAYWNETFNSLLERPVYSSLGMDFINVKLDPKTVYLAAGYNAVCCFVNDIVSEEVLNSLKELNISLILLRCAGFNNVHIEICKKLSISAARVPAYSPNAVAEHAITLIMCLNRKVHLAFQRVKEGNFALEGLVGFDMKEKTVGVLGTGKIGRCLVQILIGFGCNVLCYDINEHPDVIKMGGVYKDLDCVLEHSDVISMHLPLLESTKNLIDKSKLEKMKKGVILINTSRGGLVKTDDLLVALKEGKLGAVGLDVYSNESQYFFEDWSSKTIQDDDLSRLLSFKNVIVTSHQAFLTREALCNIAETTLNNALEFKNGKTMEHMENTVL